MGKYSYQIIVTNLKFKPLNVWRFYNGRASVELMVLSSLLCKFLQGLYSQWLSWFLIKPQPSQV
jgi:hypothetical protein